MAYEVLCPVRFGGFATIKDPNVTQCYDKKIKTGCWGKVYHYYVTAMYGKKEGPKSDRIALTRLAPMKITSLDNTSGGNVTCTYKCTVKNNKAAGYEVQYAASKNDLTKKTGTFKAVKVKGRSNLSKAVSGLEKGKTYYFRVRAYADYTNGNSKKHTRTWTQYSDIAKVKVTSAQNVTPAHQKMKSVSNSAKGILVKWEVSSNAEGYAVYRKTGEGGSWKRIASVSGRDKTSYLDQSVKDKNGQTYYYTVRGVIGSKKSAFEKNGLGIMRLRASGLNVKSSKAGTASLTWSINGASNGYEIQYSTSKDFKNSETVTVASRKKKSTVVKNLQSGKTWYFRVRSYRKAGSTVSRSAWSPVKSVKVK